MEYKGKFRKPGKVFMGTAMVSLLLLSPNDLNRPVYEGNKESPGYIQKARQADGMNSDRVGDGN